MKKIVILVVIALFFTELAAGCPTSIEVAAESEHALGEKVEFINEFEGDAVVEYWVEDEYRTEVKARRNTTNNGVKVFTPKEEGVYVIKNRIIGCEMGSEKQVAVGKLSDSQNTEKIADSGIVQECTGPANSVCTVYKSSGAKARDAAVYLLLFVSVLLNIALIWRR